MLYYDENDYSRYNANYCETFNCIICGQPITIKYFEPTHRIYCEKCKREKDKNHREIVKEYIRLKAEVMFENALRTMERSNNCYMYELEDAINTVKQMVLQNPDSFKSICEIITAIILFDNQIEFEINYKVGNYIVDFFIPSMYICLEVDGSYHEYRLAKDGKRDIAIRQMLGPKWETIRIPTKLVEKYPYKIPDALEQMYHNTKKVRQKNNGMIPASYSRTAKAYYQELKLEDEYVIHTQKK